MNLIVGIRPDICPDFRYLAGYQAYKIPTTDNFERRKNLLSGHDIENKKRKLIIKNLSLEKFSLKSFTRFFLIIRRDIAIN